jgi:hypothetical protein
MSTTDPFDLSTVPTATTFVASNNVPPPPGPSDADIYAMLVANLNKSICNFCGLTGSGATQQTFVVNFLTPADLNTLITAMQAKGYTCTTMNTPPTHLTISAN